MTISFFDDWTYVVGADYSHREDCIHTEDVDFDPATQVLTLQSDEESGYSVLIQAKLLPEEDFESMKAKIRNELCSSEDYESVSTNWVTFDRNEVWPMIVMRYFKGDPNSEMAYIQRWNFLSSLTEKTDEENAELEFIKEWYIAKEKFKTFILSLNK